MQVLLQMLFFPIGFKKTIQGHISIWVILEGKPYQNIYGNFLVEIDLGLFM